MEPPFDRETRLKQTISEINTRELANQRAFLLGKPENELIPLEERSVEQIWEEQIQVFVGAGCLTYLGMTEDQYRATLPRLEIPSQETLARFPLPLLVEPRIPIESQLRGMDNDFRKGWIEAMKKRPEASVPENTSSQAVPYLLWANDGHETQNMAIDEALTYFRAQKPPERGLTFLELLALCRADMGIFFRNRNDYDNEGFAVSSAGSVINANTSVDHIPVIYHNYFTPLQEFGELQVDAFSENSFRPQVGWPSTSL